LELLARWRGMAGHANDLFLLGLLSVMDAILDQPLDQDSYGTSDPARNQGCVAGAIGFVRTSWKMTIAHELADWEAISTLSPRLGIKEDQMPAIYFSPWIGPRRFAAARPVPVGVMNDSVVFRRIAALAHIPHVTKKAPPPAGLTSHQFTSHQSPLSRPFPARTRTMRSSLFPPSPCFHDDRVPRRAPTVTSRAAVPAVALATSASTSQFGPSPFLATRRRRRSARTSGEASRKP